MEYRFRLREKLERLKSLLQEALHIREARTVKSEVDSRPLEEKMDTFKALNRVQPLLAQPETQPQPALYIPGCTPKPQPESVPQTLTGYSLLEIVLAEVDGQLSEDEQRWFNRRHILGGFNR